MASKRICINCGNEFTPDAMAEMHGKIKFCSDDCFDEYYEEDLYNNDLGPTGHGDICMSDADPGL